MIVRARVYGSLLEASEEWRRLGLPMVAETEEEVLATRFFFAEGREEGEVEGMAFAAEEASGDAWRCDSEGVRRVMLAMEPEELRQACRAPACSAVQSILSAVDSLYHRAEAPPVDTGKVRLSFERTRIMGILNVTPDSFSDGGRYLSKESAIARALEMADEGADIIDIGGESTRPGAQPVPAGVEMERAIPVIGGAAPSLDVPISIDTRHAEVAEAALRAGASMVNDVGGLRDPSMAEVAARNRAPVVLMHMQGEPRTMQSAPRYADVVGDICLFFDDRLREAEAKGLAKEMIVLDPGIGFGKTVEHNLEILRRLREFSCLGRPLMVGASRKGFIGRLLGTKEDERLEGSLAAAAAAIMNGASIVRAHDVLETRRLARVVDAIKGK